jgi:MFS family permease
MADPFKADPFKFDVESPGGFRAVLRNTTFRNIWFAQLAAQLADKFLLFSLIILAYEISGGSTPVAVTLLTYTVPAVLFAPPAGVIADRLDRKQIMLWCNLGRAAAVALIPLAALVPQLRGDFVHLLVITFIFSAVGQLFGPAEAAVIPTILPRSALITANSLALLTMVLTLVVGGALAPIVSRIDLYAPYGLAAALLVVGATFIFASDIPGLERTTEPPVAASRNRFHRVLIDLKEGIDALRASRGLMLAFGQVSIAVLVLFMLFALAPAYVSNVIGIAPQDSYVILGPATGGAILSAVLLGQFVRNIDRSRLLIGSLIANGVTMLALAAVPQAMTQLPDLRVHARSRVQPHPRDRVRRDHDPGDHLPDGDDQRRDPRADLRPPLHGHQRGDGSAGPRGRRALGHHRHRPRDRRTRRAADHRRRRCAHRRAARSLITTSVIAMKTMRTRPPNPSARRIAPIRGRLLPSR